MQSTNSDKDSADHSSRKRLVRILIIIGIGIPVLIELMTLFNLINVQLFGNEEEINGQPEPVKEVRKFVEGDTLFAEQPLPLIVDLVRIKVSVQRWRFVLKLTRQDTSTLLSQEIKIDSLELKSGDMLDVQQTYSWASDKKKPYITDDWELPSGDIPVVVYVSSEQPVSGDSLQFIQQKVPLGNIPVRYTRQRRQE